MNYAGYNGFYGDFYDRNVNPDATLTRSVDKKTISTSTKPPSGVISVSSRVPIKSTTVSVSSARNDDSANYSLSSSNTSAEQVTVVDQARQKVVMQPIRRPTNEYATSVV
jgi:hypothetical protein